MISIGSDNLLILKSLYDVAATQYVSTATVTASLTKQDNTLLATVQLPYVGPKGLYRGILLHGDTAILTPGTSYNITYTATLGPTVLIIKNVHVANYTL